VPTPSRILSSPVRLTGAPRLAHLSMLVSADALARRGRAEGHEVTWVAASLAGDLAGQHSVERALAREGLDRQTVGREEFIERVRAAEAEARERMTNMLATLGAELNLEPGALDSPAAALAARTAFVRLYEEGRLKQAERVVNICPHCETVVDDVDSEDAELPSQRVVISLPLVNGEGDILGVPTTAPELLPGAVAVAVDGDHPHAGASVELPLAGREVPIVVDQGEPRLVVPAHDASDLELARRLGLSAPQVIDSEGVVRAEGPLDGLSRFAAREAAAKLLTAEGAIAASDPVSEVARRCRRCGTLLVPCLGRHWFLDMADLEVAAVDAVRDGLFTLAPPSALDDLVERAGQGGEWCLSHQVWAGQPVPVSRCLDCNQLAVAVEPADACGKCMGLLEADDGVLDARFVGAVWPLAMAGWPGTAAEKQLIETASDTMLLVNANGLIRWALPMAALGLRLAGLVPFAHVALHRVDLGSDDRDPELEADLEALVDAEGRPIVRSALVAGGLNIDEARHVVSCIAAPADGDTDVDALMESIDGAYAAGQPGTVLTVLAPALGAGIPPDSIGRIQAASAPILGA
jgi:valyl-tRNA synthetase